MAKKDQRKQQAPKKPTSALSVPSYYLEHIKMTSFGHFANMIVGPFGPGMNVVYGPNEAGKTTLTELVKGVLFGWPAARGETNSYRPEHADRVGSLFFKNTATGDVVELKRTKNSDDLKAPSPLMTNIDRETYETMFSLTSKELLRLDRHSEITAHLLTAGSGTSASPAHALEKINQRIKAITSKSGQVPGAIGVLKDEQARMRAEVRSGREEADALRDQERLLASLRPRSEMLAQTQVQLNAEIEDLNKTAAQLEAYDKTIEQARANLASLRQTVEGTGKEAPEPPGDIAAVAHISQAEEYRLRDRLDDFEQRQAKFEHAVDNARQAANASQAAYELHVEDGRLQQSYDRARKQRRVQLALAIIVPLIMIAVGLYIIQLASHVTGASYYMVGVFLMVVALIFAVVGIAVSLRPSRTEESWNDERAKKEWVMHQDKKTLEVCEQQAQDYADQIEAYLNEQGLGAAQGSIRRARRLLDEVREYRAACDLAHQSHQAQALHASNTRRELHAAITNRKQLCLEKGLDKEASVGEVEQLIERKVAERAKTADIAHETERQIGEISERLSAARRAMAFDEAKFESETIETRLNDSYRELAVLLLARHSLEEAISQWERKSQPEVYRCASRLFSQMTGGAWQTVRMNAQGEIEVVDAIKTCRLPYLLSLGTRQQLYLSLRIALLMTAENVGRGLPILCDDILVNFDDARRKQAVAALVELATKRQIILFTCHPDVAKLVSEADSNSKLIEL